MRLLLASLLGLAAVSSASASYYELYTLPQVQAGVATTNRIWGFTFAGNDLIVGLNGTGTNGEINRVSGGTVTNLVGPATIGGFLGVQWSMEVTPSGAIQFGNTTSSTIHRIVDGNYTTYVPRDVITSYITTTFATSGDGVVSTGSAMHPTTGEFFFYESRADAILATSNGALTTVVTPAQLVGLTTTNVLNGGMAFDAAGAKLFFGSNTTDALYVWDIASSSGSVVLTASQINGTAAIAVNDIALAPNGRVYFYEGQVDNIYSFDPANPVGTLTTELTAAQLTAGPAATSVIGDLGFTSSGNLAFVANVNGTLGVYVVPEPSTLALGALGALAGFVVLRRRR